MDEQQEVLVRRLRTQATREKVASEAAAHIEAQAKQIKAGYDAIAMTAKKLKQLGDHIEAQAAEIEELQGDLEWLDKKIGAFGDVDDGRTRITRLQAACHVLCHRDQIATQLESEWATQVAELTRLREVVEAVEEVNKPDNESDKGGIETIMDLLAPSTDRFHLALWNLAEIAEKAGEKP